MNASSFRGFVSLVQAWIMCCVLHLFRGLFPVKPSKLNTSIQWVKVFLQALTRFFHQIFLFSNLGFLHLCKADFVV